MPRTVRDYRFTGPQEPLFVAVHSYLMSEGYEYIIYHDEVVFKKGHGIASGPTFIKISFGEDLVRLEGWLKFAALPGVYAGESDLHGVMGFAVKGPLKKRYAWIESMIVQGGGQLLGTPNNPVPLPPMPFMPAAAQSTDPDDQDPASPQPNAAPQQPSGPEQPSADRSAPRFCTNCGAPLEPGAAFCTQCGKAV